MLNVRRTVHLDDDLDNNPDDEGEDDEGNGNGVGEKLK